jgi:hypothetical protein
MLATDCKAVAKHKQPVGPPIVWRDSCPSTLLLLPVSLKTWPFQNCARTWCLEILFGVVFTKLMAYFGEEISELLLCCWRLSPMEIYAYFQNFWIGQPTNVKFFHCLPNHKKEGVGGVTLERDGRGLGGRLRRERVVFSGYRSEQCQGWGVQL